MNILEEFKNKIRRQKEIPQSFLLYGQDDLSLISESIDFAKILLCLKEGEDNCNCKSCDLIGKEEVTHISHPDFLCLDIEWGQNSRSGLGVKEVRSIVHQLSMSPLLGSRKVALLRYVDYFNKESANTLLKILEEPNKSSYLILIAKNLNKVLPTIKSRTINLELRQEADVEGVFELSTLEREWINILGQPLDKRFELAEKLVNEKQTTIFLKFLEDYLIRLNRKEVNLFKKEIISDRASFLKYLLKIKDILTRTNANKRLGLECVMIEVEKARI